MMPQPNVPNKMKYVPHKVLVNNATYISVADTGVVIEIHVDVAKVNRVLDEKGDGAFTPDRLPLYFFSNNIRSIVLTKEEWLVKKQLLENGE